MKTLLKHLEESLSTSPSYFRISYYKKLLEEYYEGMCIPSNILENIENGINIDYILENLNTHDVDLLIKKLKDSYPEIKITKASEGTRLKKGGIIVSNIDFNDDNFYDLIEFYGYDVTAQDSRKAYVNPVKSDRADDYVYNKNYGQLYHFTTKDKVDSILKNGLRIKEGSYRYFPRRIYLYSTTKKLKDIDNIEDFMKEVTGLENINDVSILKINLHGHKIPMYHDETMEEGAVYCYNNIPSKFIKKIR